MTTAVAAIHESQYQKTDEVPTTYIFRSKFPDIDIHNNRSLHEFCFENVAEVADRPCLINGSTGENYTYKETHLICRKTAAGLAELGVGQGDVIMLLLQNCPEFVFAFMGASMIGASTTAANPFCTPREVLKQFKASNSKLIVTLSIYAEKLRADEEFQKFDGGLTIITVDSPLQEAFLPFSTLSNSDETKIPDVKINPNDAVALPFSSGTTGLPKGVVLTHKSLITSISQQVEGENPHLYMTSSDVVLCVLPLFHIFSLNTVLLCSLRSGSTIVLMNKFEITAMLELVQNHKISIAALVPPLVLTIAKNPIVENYDMSSVRLVQSGGAPLGKELEEALRSRMPRAICGQGYGMTEAGPVLSVCPGFAKRPLPTKPGSCGTAVRNAELKVVDPETGVSLPHNQPGEICIRGQQIMKGYLNDPEATSRTIDVDGWLHTGDIGYVDLDGEVFIVDRVKELIKFKGFQVPPAELEALLISHESIADAAVVPQKNETAGEVPVAFVVRSSESAITEEEIKEFIAKQVVFYKKLHKVYFIDAIPKSPAGKILRKDLKANLATYSYKLQAKELN